MGRALLLCPPTSDINLFGNLVCRTKVRFVPISGRSAISPVPQIRDCIHPSASCERKLLKSVAFEDLGARVDAPGVRHDQLPVLSLQERSSDLTRPDDEVPQAIKLLNDDVHLSVPRSMHSSKHLFIATVLRFTPRSSDHRFSERNSRP